ncbi:MAG: 16S rRNA (guanine(527)-N(7))-methyltransferase RsmG [Acidiferrobacterales bacterium]
MSDLEAENERQSAKLRLQLIDGATQLNVKLNRAAEDKLMAYLQLLAKWNKVFNLTAIDDPQRVVSHHLLDCLAIAAFVRGSSVLDVGSGAGLPGIPLAIVLPEKRFVLLDSNGKKTRFLVQAVAELALTNVDVVNARVEKYKGDAAFDTITARAFSRIEKLLDQSARLCDASGCYLFMKGREPAQEIAEMAARFSVTSTHLLNVPGVEGQRRLLIVEPAQSKV